MINLKTNVVFICSALCVVIGTSTEAKLPWQFKMTTTMSLAIDSPYELITTADLDGNGIKELVVTDFGPERQTLMELDHIDGHHFNIYAIEWQGKKLQQRFHKRWIHKRWAQDQKAFEAYWARQIVAWPLQDRAAVEALPPYLGLRWEKGSYLLNEQLGAKQKTPLVGSWALPWINPDCYGDFSPGSSRGLMPECVVGIRDFYGTGEPRVVSVQGNILRVRKFEQGFPVEWKSSTKRRLARYGLTDPFGWYGNTFLLFAELGGSPTTWSILRPKKTGIGYQITPTKAKGVMEIKARGISGIYKRKTKDKNRWEYWGYHFVAIPNHPYMNTMPMLRNVRLKSDNSAFVNEDIDFAHHKSFIGIGHFVVEDIDSDGLDEIIIVEKTGKAKSGHERAIFYDIKDYIRILKWNGKKYQTMWVSPPYTKYGTNLHVADIKGSGKKQLVMLRPNGTIQVWERY